MVGPFTAGSQPNRGRTREYSYALGNSAGAQGARKGPSASATGSACATGRPRGFRRSPTPVTTQQVPEVGKYTHTMPG